MDKKIYYDMVDREIEKAMEAMFPLGAGQTTHTRARHWLKKITVIAFGQGEAYALTTLLTIKDVAEKFGITPRRVRAIAKNRHERFGIGWQLPGTNQWLFRPQDLRFLAPDEKYRRK